MFRANFGLSPTTCAYLWEDYLKQCESIPFKIEHMFYCLFFLKTYSTEDVASSRFNCDSKTYRNWNWRVIFYLDEVLDEIHWEERGSERISSSIDASELPVQRPNGKHPAIKI